MSVYQKRESLLLAFTTYFLQPTNDSTNPLALLIQQLNNTIATAATENLEQEGYMQSK